MATPGSNPLGRDVEPGARHDPLVDRRFQPDIGIARAFGAEVALAGEAGEQCRLGARHRARSAQRKRLVQHLIVPAGLVIRMEEQVSVPLDHPRHQRLAGQVDDLGVGGRGQVRPDRGDAVALDQNLPAGMRLAVHPVEYARGLQQHRLLRRLGGGEGGRRPEQHRQYKSQPAHGFLPGVALRCRHG
jgi:hypothetical protein